MGKCLLVCGGLASLGGVVEGGIVQGLDIVVVVDVLCLGFHHVGGCTVADLQTLPRMLGVGMRGCRGGIGKGIRAIGGHECSLIFIHMPSCHTHRSSLMSWRLWFPALCHISLPAHPSPR